MTLQKVEILSPPQKEAIFDIWNSAYPKQIAYKMFPDFENYLAKCEEPIHLLAFKENNVVGWLSVFKRNDQRWFALIVDPQHQKQGVGQKLLREAQQLETELFGWIAPHDNYFKADGTLYRSPRSFYVKNGFTITEETFKTDVLTTTKIHWKQSLFS